MSNVNLSAECLDAGTLLNGRYLVEFVLGRGGMGAVYFARDQAQSGEPLAVKEMRVSCDGTTQAEAVEQFRQEALFLYHLEHPGLVKVKDFFCENGRYYLTMNYVRGKTLSELLRAQSQPFAVPEVLEWARQLLDVLEYLHSQNPPILFRDMKPGNVIVEASGKISLVDFGIARFLIEGQATATILQGVGTAEYCPLEQYQGGGTDQRSDIYSLGATLYHLLTLKPPPLASEVALSGRPVPSLRMRYPQIPTLLEEMVLRMLELRKENRYTTVKQVRAALEKVVQTYEKPRKPKESPLPPKRSGIPVSLILGGLTLLMLSLLGWLILQINT